MNMDAYTYSTYWKDLHVRHAGALSAVGYCGLGEGFNQASYRLRRQALRRLERAQRQTAPIPSRNTARACGPLNLSVNFGAFGASNG
jgi:hypothetical protein